MKKEHLEKVTCIRKPPKKSPQETKSGIWSTETLELASLQFQIGVTKRAA